MNDVALAAVARIAPRLLNTAGRQRLSILIYHRVVAERDPMRPGEPTTREFEMQMRLIAKHFNPLPLAEAARRLREESLPARAVCVTFDDGYADNELLAMPVLRKLGVPATIFVSTGFLNGGRMFNDTVIEVIRGLGDGEVLDLGDLGLGRYVMDSLPARLAAVGEILREIRYRTPPERGAVVERMAGPAANLPANLMMTDDQVRNLPRNGVDVGAHTVHHPMLSCVDDETAREEITAGKEYLENLLQGEICAFAYPNGVPDVDYKLRHRDMVMRAGFRVAVSTHWGVGTPASDSLQLPRFTPWDRQPARFVLRLLANYRRVDSLLARG